MAYFDDMAKALADYPITDVVLEIIEVSIPGAVLNQGEQGTFRVRVTNNGPLNLTGVTLRIKGHNGATVAGNGAIAPFEAEFVTAELLPINAHGGSTFTTLQRFKAPGAAQDATTLIKATLETWDANFDRILRGHSRPLDVPKGTYAAEVAPA
jgi:hypothetical protein